MRCTFKSPRSLARSLAAHLLRAGSPLRSLARLCARWTLPASLRCAGLHLLRLESACSARISDRPLSAIDEGFSRARDPRLVVERGALGKMLARAVREHAAKQAVAKGQQGTCAHVRCVRCCCGDPASAHSPAAQRGRGACRSAAEGGACVGDDAHGGAHRHSEPTVRAPLSGVLSWLRAAPPDAKEKRRAHARAAYRVSEVFTNQKQLEVEAKNLQTQSAKYAKQTSQWLSMIDSFNNALKVRERARPSMRTGPCAPTRANGPCEPARANAPHPALWPHWPHPTLWPHQPHPALWPLQPLPR